MFADRGGIGASLAASYEILIGWILISYRKPDINDHPDRCLSGKIKFEEIHPN
jgi:hypothetical protein